MNQILFPSAFNIKLIEPGVFPNSYLTNKLGIISSPSFKNLIFPSKGSLKFFESIPIGVFILPFQKSHSF